MLEIISLFILIKSTIFPWLQTSFTSMFLFGKWYTCIKHQPISPDERELLILPAQIALESKIHGIINYFKGLVKKASLRNQGLIYMSCLKLQRRDFVKSPPVCSVFPDIFMCVLFWLILFHVFCFEGKGHLSHVVSSNHRPCCIRYSKKNFFLTATVDV